LAVACIAEIEPATVFWTAPLLAKVDQVVCGPIDRFVDLRCSDSNIRRGESCANKSGADQHQSLAVRTHHYDGPYLLRKIRT
jgi:hypothetical protein